MIKKMKKDELTKTADLELEIKRLNFSIEAENNFNRIVFINASFTTSGLFDLDGQVASWLLEYGAAVEKKTITDTLPPKYQDLARTLAQEKCNPELEVATNTRSVEILPTEILPSATDPVRDTLTAVPPEIDSVSSEILPNDFFDEV